MTEDIPTSARRFNEATSKFTTGLKEVGIDPTSDLYSEARGDFCDLITEICQKAECNHEKVTTDFSPQEERKSVTDHIDRVTEGGYLATYEVTCTDCGATIPAQLRLDIKREEY